MVIREYSYLPKEALEIREEVFVREQGFTDEFDEIDKISKHLLMFEGEKAISTCRIFFSQEKQTYMLGRLAVLKQWRGKGIGTKMIEAAEDIIRRDGGRSVLLSSQEQVVEFYKKQGYIREGEIFSDQGCPHIWVKKEL